MANWVKILKKRNSNLKAKLAEANEKINSLIKEKNTPQPVPHIPKSSDKIVFSESGDVIAGITPKVKIGLSDPALSVILQKNKKINTETKTKTNKLSKILTKAKRTYTKRTPAVKKAIKKKEVDNGKDG